jgi:hypothetical protein
MAPPICSSSSFLFGELIYSADSIPGKVTIINMKQEREKGKENWARTILSGSSITVEDVDGDRGRCGSRSGHARVIARITRTRSGQQESALTIDCVRRHAHPAAGRIIQHLKEHRTSDGRKKRTTFFNLLNTAEHAIIQIGFIYFSFTCPLWCQVK